MFTTSLAHSHHLGRGLKTSMHDVIKQCGNHHVSNGEQSAVGLWSKEL